MAAPPPPPPASAQTATPLDEYVRTWSAEPPVGTWLLPAPVGCE